MKEEDQKALIERFYTAFSNHDAEGMAACYHDEVVFEDPAFGQLIGAEANAMWRMLIERAKGNLKVIYQDIDVKSEIGTAKWIANYAYGAKKRPVENHIEATFQFKDGKIYKHTDHFNLWKWSSMALGPVGSLLGWTPFLKAKIKTLARKSLHKYMEKSK